MKPFKETLIGSLLTKNGAKTAGDIVANTVLSVIADKTPDAKDSRLKEKFKKGINISSNRTLNLGVTGSIIIVAISIIQAKGEPTKEALIMLGIGVVFSLGMELIKYLKEK